MKKQEAPFSIQIEFTEGCNLYCDFCGIRGIRKRPGKFKFMLLKDAKIIAKRIRKTKWNSRIEFAMHGEPTANPKFIEMIGVFRRYLLNNQLMITTNGFGIVKDPVNTIIKMFRAGINVIAIDDYDHNKSSKVIKEKIYKMEDVHFYPKEKKYSPHNRYPKGTQIIVFMEDISKSTSGTHSKLNNHCGCAFPPLSKSLGKRCAKPFREMSIRYDGHICVCCNDWAGHYVCGNILKEEVEEIWNNKYFHAARKILYSNKRNFTPCKWCNAISYRVGFLPDKMGKDSLPCPTSVTYRLAEKATAEGTLTKQVRFFKPSLGIKGLLQ